MKNKQKLEGYQKKTPPKKKSGNKYGSEMCYHNGIRFHSKAERWYYQQLLLMEKQGMIKILELQPKFIVDDGFTRNGKKYHDVYYISDFKIKDLRDNKVWIVDTKGSYKLPRSYTLKRNRFLMQFDYNFKEVYIKNYKVVKEIIY